MLYSIPGFEKIPSNLIYSFALVFALLLDTALLLTLKNKLPKDQGREYAVDGELSAGKPKAAGILFITAFALSSLLFIPFNLESAAYIGLVMLGMFSGFFDDKSKKPWGEYKKGVIDLFLGAAAAAAFIFFNPALHSVQLGGFVWQVPKVLFGLAATVLVWVSINATNCSDGIDGFSGSLSLISIASLSIYIFYAQRNDNILLMAALMGAVLLPYLWLNAEPSKLMMGDAGSRAIGLFISILALKTGNALLFIPLCLVLIFNGTISIVKVSLIRFLRINPLKNIRTPFHDHLRKNRGWSNTQTIYRLCIVQLAVSALTLLLLYK